MRGGVQLTVGAEMEAYGDQAAAASHQFCYKSRKESSRKQSGAIGKSRQRSLWFLETTFQDPAKYNRCVIAP